MPVKGSVCQRSGHRAAAEGGGGRAGSPSPSLFRAAPRGRRCGSAFPRGAHGGSGPRPRTSWCATSLSFPIRQKHGRHRLPAGHRRLTGILGFVTHRRNRFHLTLPPQGSQQAAESRFAETRRERVALPGKKEGEGSPAVPLRNRPPTPAPPAKPPAPLRASPSPASRSTSPAARRVAGP